MLEVKDPQLFEIFASIPMLQQDLTEDRIRHEELSFEIGSDFLSFGREYIQSPHPHYLPGSEFLEELLLADLVELCPFSEPVFNFGEFDGLVVQKGRDSLF